MWILDLEFWILNSEKKHAKINLESYFKIILAHINIFCIFAS
jgi:hypothetical protein